MLGVSWTLAKLIECLVARGAHAEADRLLAQTKLPDPLPGLLGCAYLVTARGRLHCAAGRYAEACTDLREARRRWQDLPMSHPTMADWRPPLVRALAARGEQDEAQRLAEEEWELARATGLPRSIGIALLTRAAVAPPLERRAHLEEAVAELRGCPAPLELAEALLQLGSTHSILADRDSARTCAHEAFDLAQGHGERRAEWRLSPPPSGVRPRWWRPE